MLYQLPTGKVIRLSVEQYLDMSDEDIDYIVRHNLGEYVRSPFHESAIKDTKKKKKEEPNEEDRAIDYSPDLEERDHYSGPTDGECAEDFPELPDDAVE